MSSAPQSPSTWGTTGGNKGWEATHYIVLLYSFLIYYGTYILVFIWGRYVTFSSAGTSTPKNVSQPSNGIGDRTERSEMRRAAKIRLSRCRSGCEGNEIVHAIHDVTSSTFALEFIFILLLFLWPLLLGSYGELGERTLLE